MGKMNVAAVICEYNPFHSGHAYHLEETRRLCGADYIICVMSGDFVQRGEPAIISKWARAEMTLQCGADMVIELPLPYSISSAQYFADGAVDTICKMSVVTHISFGSESFEGVLDEEKCEELTVSDELYIDKALMKQGMSYTAASRVNGVSAPNDVLGAEYVRALKRRGSDIKPAAVKRKGSVHDGIGSALDIRRILLEGEEMPRIRALMPENAADILQREISGGRCPVRSEAFEQAIFAFLRALGPDGIRSAAPVSEGLEYKIYSAACEAPDYASLIDSCTSLRYTASRIRRAVLAAILGLTSSMVKSPAPYIRVLGMRKDCGALMDALCGRALVPVITSKAKFMKTQESQASDVRAFLDIQGKAADIYALGYPSKDERNAQTDMTHPLVYV